MCGKLGHGEGFYLIRMKIRVHDVDFDWDFSLKVQSRWKVSVGSKWLRDDSSKGSQNDGNSWHGCG